MSADIPLPSQPTKWLSTLKFLCSLHKTVSLEAKAFISTLDEKTIAQPSVQKTAVSLLESSNCPISLWETAKSLTSTQLDKIVTSISVPTPPTRTSTPQSNTASKALKALREELEIKKLIDPASPAENSLFSSQLASARESIFDHIEQNSKDWSLAIRYFSILLQGSKRKKFKTATSSSTFQQSFAISPVKALTNALKTLTPAEQKATDWASAWQLLKQSTFPCFSALNKAYDSLLLRFPEAKRNSLTDVQELLPTLSNYSQMSVSLHNQTYNHGFNSLTELDRVWVDSLVLITACAATGETRALADLGQTVNFSMLQMQDLTILLQHAGLREGSVFSIGKGNVKMKIASIST